jgi:hypothetical protein
VDQEIPLLTGELLSNLKEWRQARQDFKDSPTYEKPGRHPATAQALAASDPRRSDAITYTGYYRDEAHACAAALTALRGVREDLKQR